MPYYFKNFLVATSVAGGLATCLAAPARAEALLHLGAEIYIPLATTVTADGRKATLSNQKAGGFFILSGYRFLKGLDVTAEYVFLQHYAKLTADDGKIFAKTSDGDRFYVSHHLALANVGYRFGRNWGLKDFGIYLGSGIGAEIVNGAVAGGEAYNNIAMILPFKFGVDYRVNNKLTMGIYSRYYLPLFAKGKANDAVATMSSAGGFSFGLSFASNF